MAIKRRPESQKKEVSFEDAEKLADELADKVYGEHSPPSATEKPDERITITLPYHMYEYLDETARLRKKAKEKNKSISAIVREAIVLHMANKS